MVEDLARKVKCRETEKKISSRKATLYEWRRTDAKSALMISRKKEGKRGGGGGMWETGTSGKERRDKRQLQTKTG